GALQPTDSLATRRGAGHVGPRRPGGPRSAIGAIPGCPPRFEATPLADSRNCGLLFISPVLAQAHREAGAGAPRRVRGGLLRVPEEGDDGTGQRLPWDCSQHLRAAPEPRGASRRSRDAPDGPDAFRPRRGRGVGGLLEVQSRTRAVRPARGPGGSRRRGETRSEGGGGDRRIRPPVSGADPRAHPHGKRGSARHPARARGRPVRTGGPRILADHSRGRNDHLRRDCASTRATRSQSRRGDRVRPEPGGHRHPVPSGRPEVRGTRELLIRGWPRNQAAAPREGRSELARRAEAASGAHRAASRAEKSGPLSALTFISRRSRPRTNPHIRRRWYPRPMQKVAVPTDLPAIGPFSWGVKLGDLVFVAGQGPLGPDGKVIEGDIRLQTRKTLENFRKVVESA